LFATLTVALNNGLARVPQMGFNTWNHFNCHINETLIQETADELVSSGLFAAGYEYMNLDDCWALSRSSNGTIQPDPVAFPSGMAALASYVHGKGLKFGLYSDAGYKTCAGRPGSLNYEVEDANTYASWQVDYLKYDNCNTDGSTPEHRYPIMRDALNQTNRQIFFSMCEWGVDNPATWAPTVGNSWRTTQDISDNWASMIQRADWNNEWTEYAAPGGWNDPDMLEVGNGGMTVDEYTTHFSLWVLMKSPLLIGCDIRNLAPEYFNILANPDVIAVSQDTLGVQGQRVASWNSSNDLQKETRPRRGYEYFNGPIPAGNSEVWAIPLSTGAVGVILLNRANPNTTTITVQWSQIGVNGDAKVYDLWAQESLGAFSNSFSASVRPHAVSFVSVTPLQ